MSELVEDEIGGARLLQPRRGYRVDRDTPALIAFAAPRPGERVLDLGCGGGVLTVLAALAQPAARACVGLELFPRPSARAAANLRLNGLATRAAVVRANLRTPPLRPRCADLVLVNPPHFPAGAGRLSRHDESAAATHELFGGLDDFLAAAAHALAPAGRVCVYYPRARLDALLAALPGSALTAVRLRLLERHALCEARRPGYATALLIDSPIA